MNGGGGEPPIGAALQPSLALIEPQWTHGMPAQHTEHKRGRLQPVRSAPRPPWEREFLPLAPFTDSATVRKMQRGPDALEGIRAASRQRAVESAPQG